MTLKSEEITTLSTATQLSRRQVADRLGISTSSVRRLEGDLLNPSSDENGVWWFDPAEVEAARMRGPIRGRPAPSSDPAERQRARAGRLAATVFRMFARGRPLAEIVVLTKQPPERVRALYHEWVTSLEAGEWDRPER
jgi:transcriptional regulator with XRE-family HTH domain